MRPKSYCALLLGGLSLLLLATFFYLYSQRGLLNQYRRGEYLRVTDSDIKVLETKKAIESFKIKGLEEELAYSYAALVVKQATVFELDPLDVVSVIWQESRFNPQAISPTGDYGLMGINWYYVGRHRVKEREDLFNAEKNIRIGVEMLNYWRELSRKNARGDFIPIFFGHYNQGVFVQNENYGKAIMNIRQKLAVYQILIPNHSLAMENNNRAIKP
ncbi:transglycosylase SLT domain-containing protein [Candidatus Uhrbacteria bacterium]|nr:transglycosylase SLT domain-containing protein [Candidatus Uhrbacteria bacterium]